MCLYLFFTYTRYRYLYSGGSIDDFGDFGDARYAKCNEIYNDNFIEIRHCIYTTITISAYLCTYYCLTILYTPSIAFRDLRWYTHLAARNTEENHWNFSPVFILFFFSFYIRLRSLFCISPWIIIHDSCIPLAALHCHGSWSLVSLWNHTATLKREMCRHRFPINRSILNRGNEEGWTTSRSVDRPIRHTDTNVNHTRYFRLTLSLTHWATN